MILCQRKSDENNIKHFLTGVLFLVFSINFLKQILSNKPLSPCLSFPVLSTSPSMPKQFDGRRMFTNLKWSWIGEALSTTGLLLNPRFFTMVSTSSTVAVALMARVGAPTSANILILAVTFCISGLE